MGFETHRFQGDVDEELLCPICSGVLEEPLQVLHAIFGILSLLISMILSRVSIKLNLEMS